jgi:hypothetical protein
LLSGRKPITCKWIFKIKYKADGTIQKYKALLIAKGFTQVPRVDFGETFSLVVKLTTIRVLLTLAIQYDLEVHQLDTKTTFLNGYIHEKTYMEIMKGLHTSNNSNMVSFDTTENNHHEHGTKD